MSIRMIAFTGEEVSNFADPVAATKQLNAWRNEHPNVRIVSIETGVRFPSSQHPEHPDSLSLRGAVALGVREPELYVEPIFDLLRVWYED